MSSIYHGRLTVSIFGQSHAPGVGVTMDGLPAGEAVDLEELQAFLARRAPGGNAWSTTRKEGDVPEFLSGLADGKTCGAPLAAVIRNTNIRSKDYSNLKDVPRPGHADYTAQVKYGGFQDVAGGGHFSGRLTAPLCIAGGICKQILARRGIFVGAHIAAIGGIPDTPFDPVHVDKETLLAPGLKPFPVSDDGAGEKMQAAIAAAFKLTNLFFPIRVDKVLNPAVSILLEGLSLAALLALCRGVPAGSGERCLFALGVNTL